MSSCQFSPSVATPQVVEEVKKVPKSKTWFLGGRMAKAKAKGGAKGRRRSTLTQAALEAKANAASEVTKEQQPVVKREPKPADPLVFLGSEDIVLDADKFELKSPSVSSAGLDRLRSRVSSGLGAVSGIMAKLGGGLATTTEPEKEPTSTKEAVKEAERKPEGDETKKKDAKKFPELGPVIATDEVVEYSDKVSRVPKIWVILPSKRYHYNNAIGTISG